MWLSDQIGRVTTVPYKGATEGCRKMTAQVQTYSSLVEELERLRQHQADLQQERDDLEMMLDTSLEHATMIENELKTKNDLLSNALQVQQRTQELLVQSRKRAQEATRVKSSFLANMSHELRTPLNAILSYTDILQDEATDLNLPEFVADLGKIKQAGKHLLGLINSVLDLSRIEAGKMPVYLETFDVANMVQDVITTISPLVEKNKNRLEVICPPEIGWMRADATKLHQALLNLLSNACKFTEAGLITMEVKTKGLTGIEWIYFSVKDSGIGITPEQLENLFQEFSQADVSTTRKYGGSGLGLAISRQFCRMMGGDISVTSQAGVGSDFVIELPRLVKLEKSEVSISED